MPGPVITSLPSAAHPGDHITLKGENFGASQGTKVVVIDTSRPIPSLSPPFPQKMQALSWSDTKIEAKIPPPLSFHGEGLPHNYVIRIYHDASMTSASPDVFIEIRGIG